MHRRLAASSKREYEMPPDRLRAVDPLLASDVRAALPAAARGPPRVAAMASGGYGRHGGYGDRGAYGQDDSDEYAEPDDNTCSHQ